MHDLQPSCQTQVPAGRFRSGHREGVAVAGGWGAQPYDMWLVGGDWNMTFICPEILGIL